jgi:hypothetical protein
MRSKFEGTRRTALKFGAHGTTLKAYKPWPVMGILLNLCS